MLLLALVLSAMPAWSQQRSVEEVLEIVASSARPQMVGALKSKSYGQKVASLQPSSQLVGSLVPQGVSVTMHDANEAFYVYSPGEGQGFMIVSADQRMSPVLGYCDQGDFSVSDMPDNVKAWLLNYVAEAQQLGSQIGGDSPIAGKNAIAATGSGVGPLLTTRWNQNSPYNDLCPTYSGTNKAVTGCVATSMAQAMNYYKYPTTGTGSKSYISDRYSLFLSQDFSKITFKWDLMKDSYTGSTATEAEKQAVAELMYACGVSVNMDYGPSSGSSQVAQMHALANNFGYDEDMFIINKDYMLLDDWHAKLLGELDLSRPLLISGITPSGYGHSFIIDGYTPDGEDYPYYHLNWGWGGSYDGYYKMTNMSDNGKQEDAYTQKLAAIMNFKPDNGVTEMANYLQMQSVVAESNNVDLTAGQKLVINYDTIINCANTTFVGEVAFYLVDGSGQRTKVYSFNLSGLPTNTFTYGSATCTVPTTLESGDYTLVVAATAISNGIERLVETSCDPIVVSIVNDASFYYPEIMSTGVTVTTSSSNNQVLNLAASQIMNFATTPFTGTLQMVYGDYYGGVYGSFGSTRSLNNLSQYGYYSSTFNFSGSLPTGLADGAYKCYLGARQSGYTSWGIVKGYTLENNYIMSSGLDASTNFWIKNGKVTLTAPYKRGDANSDNSVDVADLAALIRLILNDHKSHDFIFYASDMNDDADLNVGDYGLLVNKIVYGAASKSFSAASQSYSVQAEGNGALVGVEIEETGEDEYRLAVCLNNESADFNAMQFDINLPIGFELAEEPVYLTERARGFRANVGNNRVVISNLADMDFKGAEGAVAYVNLKCNGAAVAANQSLALTNIVLSESEACESFRLSDVVISADELTGISSVLAANCLQVKVCGNGVTISSSASGSVKIVNATGQLVKLLHLSAGGYAKVPLPAGVYVVNNTKVIVK